MEGCTSIHNGEDALLYIIEGYTSIYNGDDVFIYNGEDTLLYIVERKHFYT